MQASAQDDAASARGRTFERIAEVRKLGGRKVSAVIVHAFSPVGAEIDVVERYAAGAGLDAQALASLERDARTAMSLRHPNVAAVRDVWLENGELAVASEYVEGETLEELRKLAAGGKELSIEVGVRMVVDVLSALSALHTLGSGALAHGEITAANLIVGYDGATRVVRPYRGRVAGKVAEADWFSYAAPEVVRGGAPDARADLYAVGVLLWETLTRRKLFPKATREGRAARSVPVGKPAPPADAAWAAPLGAVAERALANDPAARYTSAAEMAAAVRLAVRSKLAMPPRVAAVVDKLAGEKILARRTANALPEVDTTGARLSGRPSRPSLPPEAVRALSAMKPSSRPPTPKPGAVAPVVPKAPALPKIEAGAKTPPPAPAAPPLPRRASARPPAPPLDLTPPPPKAEKPASLPPISIDDAFVESAPAPAAAAPIVTPAAAPAPPASQEPVSSAVPAGLPKKSNNRLLLIVAAALIGIVALAAVVRAVAFSGSSHATEPSTKTKTPAATTVTATAPRATATATAEPTTSAAPEATTAPSASAAPDDSASAAPDTTPTAAPTETHRPRARPRPTYDPMGI